ncbi:MAG TPA: ABC transporter ATP-binding protein [Candidatus Mediterraneibacter pullistercoris]|nr:ABC transporter ATP-binding protein [Candidatus Mediterraneibacter pullistercoris]
MKPDSAGPGEAVRPVQKPAMEVRDLFFSYGKNKVLKGTSFTIEEGKITTIMGANGCGKSTLFNLMTKNLYPRKGNIFLHGKNIQNLGLKDFARRVSIVHQYNSSADDITVERLVSFGRTPHMKMMQGHSDEDEKLIQWAMEVTNVLKYRDREVSRLSGGQRQRVWIAMALAQNTKILFLDEPTTYLDIRYQIEILELVKKLNREYGITIIMVLHDINQAIHFSDRIIGLKDGQVTAQGAPDAVITEECIRELYGISLGVTTIEGKKFVLTV